MLNPGGPAISSPLMAFLMFAVAACTTVVPPVATPRDGAAQSAQTVRVQRGDITGLISLSGELRPRNQQAVAARVTGRVERVAADVGSPIQQGQAVVELEPAAFELRVVQAEAALAAAEARLAALGKARSPEDRVIAEATLRAARVRLEALERAPRAEPTDQLLSNAQVARQRVSQLEAVAIVNLARVEAGLGQAGARLEQLQRDPTTSPAMLAQARQQLQQAEESAAQLRRQPGGSELAQARLELEAAEERVLLARVAVSDADVEVARAQLEVAEAMVRRVHEPTPPAEMRAAEAAVRRGQLELEVARIEARLAVSSAPMSGLLAEIFVRPGVLVASGTPLFSVVSAAFEMQTSLPEAQLALVSAGQPVRVGVEAYPGQEFAGVVLAVAPVVETRLRVASLRIEVGDPGGKLKSGLYAQATVQAAPRREALLVPRDAVLGRPPETHVYQVIDGRARRQTVQIGVSDGRSVEIVGGIGEGAEIVLSASGQAEGAVIR